MNMMADGALKPSNVSEKLVCEERYKSAADCAFARARRQNNCPVTLLRARGRRGGTKAAQVERHIDRI